MTNAEKIIFVAPYVELPDGALSFVDADSNPEAWVTQLRVPTPNDDFCPFDVPVQEHSNDRTGAMRAAKELANEHGCKIIEH